MNEFLAKIFESFKSKSPKVAAAVILLLISIITWSQNGLGDIIGYDLTAIAKYAAIALVALTGAHTTEILKPSDTPKKP